MEDNGSPARMSPPGELDDMESPIKSEAPGATAKKGGSVKKSTTTKAKTSTSSPGKKGGKKKKVKEEKSDIDWAIPEDKGTKPLFNFMPDRATMQRLVTRASTLKDAEPPVMLREIKPWLRIANQDLEV